jgi:hypothetical protein
MKTKPIIMRDESHSEYCKCEVCAGNAPRGEIRCACFIPGGIQCVKPMYHIGAHVYDPVTPFSTYTIPPPRQDIPAAFFAGTHYDICGMCGEHHGPSGVCGA